MNMQNEEENDTADALADDVREFMGATADSAGDKIEEARKRLTAALKSGGKLLHRVEKNVIEGAKCTDKAVRSHPYQAIGIAVAVGVLVGYIAARKCNCKNA